MSKDGGPAFPRIDGIESDDHVPGRQHVVVSDGMTLRDYFAGAAMEGHLSGMWVSDKPHGWSHDDIAREAYSMADAMLKAREA